MTQDNKKPRYCDVIIKPVTAYRLSRNAEKWQRSLINVMIKATQGEEVVKVKRGHKEIKDCIRGKVLTIHAKISFLFSALIHWVQVLTSDQ